MFDDPIRKISTGKDRGSDKFTLDFTKSNKGLGD